MSEAGEVTVLPTPRKFKLRRVKPSPPQELIEQNLLPLKENIKKKKRAQEAYYESNLGVSPLNRSLKKRPVHQRLGRRVPFNGTNTSVIPPKLRLHRPSNFTPQDSKRRRIFSAQQRLNHIRAQHRDLLSRQNYGTPKKIKLRRTLPQRIGLGPTNLQVEVKNNRAFYNMPHITTKRFKQILNMQLQHEIKKIQVEFSGEREIIVPTGVTPVATNLPLHVRFATLS